MINMLLPLLRWAIGSTVVAPVILATVVTYDLTDSPYNMVSYASAKTAVDDALDDAFAYLSTHPTDTVELYFPAGTWYIDHTTAAIKIQDLPAGNLVIKGAGESLTKLIFNQFDEIGIYVLDSDNVTIRDIELSRDALYTTQGEVISVSAGEIIFETQAGFPDPVVLAALPLAQNNERTFLRFTGPALDPEVHPQAQKILLLRNGVAIEDYAGGYCRAFLEDDNEIPDLSAGDRIALKAKVGNHTVRVNRCDNLLVEHVTFTRAAAVPLMILNDCNGTVARYVTVARDAAISGNAPFYSTPGGGPQFTAGSVGPLVEYCTIVAPADDGIALFSDDPDNLQSGAIVRYNTVRDNPRGINITQSTDGLCYGNTLIRNVGPSIQIRTNHTGVGTNAVTGWEISDNTFIEAWSGAVIELNSEVSAGLHDDIDIKDNIFIGAPKNNAMIEVANSDEVRIDGNVIQSFSSEEDFWGDGMPHPAPMVLVLSGLNVHGTGNTCDEPTSRYTLVEGPFNTGAVDIEWADTAVGAAAAVFYPSADTYADKNNSTTNYGTSNGLRVRSSATHQQDSYLKFVVSDHLIGTITGAKLRIYADDVEMDVTASTTSTTWDEMTLTWANRPAAITTLDTQYSGTDTWIEFDVGSVVTTDGTYAFVLSGDDNVSGHNFLSRESSKPSQLVVYTATPLTPGDAVLVSAAAEDGYIVESLETSDEGGSANSSLGNSVALRIGDWSNNRQYRTIVSFDTSALPDEAVIVSATLKLIRGSATGDPTVLGDIVADIRSGSFSGSASLQEQDFEAAASVVAVSTLSYPASDGDPAVGSLDSAGRAAINKTGRTQFRVYFITDDDNDSTADYLGFFSGDNSTPENRPVLELHYYAD